MKEEKNVQYHVGQAFFLQVDPGFEVFSMFCQGWFVDPSPPGVVYRKTLIFCRKFQFIGNLKVTQFFLTIAR